MKYVATKIATKNARNFTINLLTVFKLISNIYFNTKI